jgi:hypothetical protein
LCARISLLDAALFNHFQQKESPESKLALHFTPLGTGVLVIDNVHGTDQEDANYQKSST